MRCHGRLGIGVWCTLATPHACARAFATAAAAPVPALANVPADVATYVNAPADVATDVAAAV